MEFKINFKIDYISNEEIPIQNLSREIKKLKIIKRKNFYITEIADFYYKKKYQKNIVEILENFFNFPKCPITGKIVSYKLAGKIIFGKYSSDCSSAEMAKHISINNEKYKEHISRMKEERKGAGNPMHNNKPWNKGLSSETNETIKKTAEKRIGWKPSDETKKKQSESAKKRLIHGHTGFKHSEESKQVMREKTIERLKNNKFPQTNTVPHKKMKEILQNNFLDNNLIQAQDFEEEFPYGHFVFDFRVKNYLIEVQGDFFHANPNTRHSGATHMIQKINISRDRSKKNFVE